MFSQNKSKYVLTSHPVHPSLFSVMKNQSITFTNPITQIDVRYYAFFRSAGESIVKTYAGPTIESAHKSAVDDAYRNGWKLRRVTNHPASF
jgi:hypothetical protein